MALRAISCAFEQWMFGVSVIMYLNLGVVGKSVVVSAQSRKFCPASLGLTVLFRLNVY